MLKARVYGAYALLKLILLHYWAGRIRPLHLIDTQSQKKPLMSGFLVGT
jgi:hypothetical protein